MQDDKLYLSYAQIHETVQHAAREIISSPFDPELMVAIGTRGFIPARILKTCVDRPILTVAVSDKPQTIQWIDEVEEKLPGRRILLVDEVDDTRVTLEYTLTELLRHGPAEINHYFVGRTLEDRWIVYPWDALDIREHQRRAEDGQ